PFFLYTEGFRLEPVNSLVFAENFQDFRELPAKVETFFAAL
ncbi:MAG: phosphoglycolate phosphatase, partial [Rhodospirillaceae bacterium]|nr:phosphoglycolate phosphatase [Rhodospirillaceae bacterium]